MFERAGRRPDRAPSHHSITAVSLSWQGCRRDSGAWAPGRGGRGPPCVSSDEVGPMRLHARFPRCSLFRDRFARGRYSGAPERLAGVGRRPAWGADAAQCRRRLVARPTPGKAQSILNALKGTKTHYLH